MQRLTAYYYEFYLMLARPILYHFWGLSFLLILYLDHSLFIDSKFITISKLIKATIFIILLFVKYAVRTKNIVATSLSMK